VEQLKVVELNWLISQCYFQLPKEDKQNREQRTHPIHSRLYCIFTKSM